MKVAFRGPAKRVRLGDLDLFDDSDDAMPQDFDIIEAIRHPEYKFPLHYNDVGLVKLDVPAKFTSYVKPACLPTSKSQIPEGLIVTATGWGRVSFIGDLSSQLLKVDLNVLGDEQCAENYNDYKSRKLSKGIIKEQQFCAGHQEAKDACPVSISKFLICVLNIDF